MAVYTDITEIELGAFLKNYPIGELLSYKGIAEGVENTNYLLHTGSGSFILTLYEKRVERADLPFFLGLMQHLAAKGISCPVPVCRNDGEMIGELAGRPAALVTFLEGMWMRRPTVEHCRQVGAALAGLHLAGRDFALERRNALGLAGWKPLWKLSRARADEVEPGLAAEVEADLGLLEKDWPAGLPAGVIHADLFPDNVFFLGGRLSPAPISSPMTWRSASMPGVSSATTPSTSPRVRRCSAAMSACGRWKRRRRRRCPSSRMAPRCASC
jgi:homoserine kinase type II